MTTPIDELAGNEPLNDTEIDDLRETLRRGLYLPADVRIDLIRRLLATLAAARSTPVPAANVSEGLREALDSIERTAQQYVDADRVHWYRASDVRAALAHAPTEGLDEKALRTVSQLASGFVPVAGYGHMEVGVFAAAVLNGQVVPAIEGVGYEWATRDDDRASQPDATEEALR